MQSFQYVQDILKDNYGKAIINQVYKKAPLFAVFKKKTADFAGKRLVIPLQYADTQAVAARAGYNWTLPSAQRNYYTQTYIQMKRIYGRVKIDNFSIASAKGEGGWEDPLTREMKSVADAFAQQIDRMLIGDGRGILATVSSYSNGVATLAAPGGVSGDTPTNKFFKNGMIIDGYTGSTYAGTYRVENTVSTNQITISILSGNAPAANNVLYVSGAFDGTNYGELMGIRGIISDVNCPSTSDFQGIDRSVHSWWKAYVNTTSGTLSEGLIQVDLDAIDDRTAGDPVDLMLTTKALRNKLISLMQALRKVETIEFKAGWKAIKYIGGEIELPVMVHKDLPSGYIFYIATPHIKLYTLKGLEWDDRGGMIKPVAGEDAVEAWFRFYANLGTDCSNAHGVHTNVSA